jgi:hypothetical protein
MILILVRIEVVLPIGANFVAADADGLIVHDPGMIEYPAVWWLEELYEGVPSGLAGDGVALYGDRSNGPEPHHELIQCSLISTRGEATHEDFMLRIASFRRRGWWRGRSNPGRY